MHGRWRCCRELRAESAQYLTSLPFDGYAGERAGQSVSGGRADRPGWVSSRVLLLLLASVSPVGGALGKDREELVEILKFTMPL